MRIQVEQSQPPSVVQADLTYVDGRLQRGVQVEIAGGAIRRVGALGLPVRRLEGRALLPGMINAHSHAFQRGLRGLGERYPAGLGDFWSWREAMYGLVQRLDRERLLELCTWAFEEMLDAGVTTVGEFHYLHHDDAEARDFALDDVIIQSAARAGIRLVLLMSYYKTGGIGRALAGGQTRFNTPSIEQFVGQVDRVCGQATETLTIGIAPHSLRAVPVDDLAELAQIAQQRGWLFHIHVEEQAREIEEFQTALGIGPLEWLLANVSVDERLTAIHCTQSAPDQLRQLALAGANVCACPITEGNLGDGIAAGLDVLRDANVCLGSDSNLRLDFFEEMRWLEFAQRLGQQRRGIYVAKDGRLSSRLFECATLGGARALGLAAGEIRSGARADFFTLDLRHAALRGADEDSLLSAAILGAGGDAVQDVCVNGRWREKGPRHGG